MLTSGSLIGVSGTRGSISAEGARSLFGKVGGTRSASSAVGHGSGDRLGTTSDSFGCPSSGTLRKFTFYLHGNIWFKVCMLLLCDITRTELKLLLIVRNFRQQMDSCPIGIYIYICVCVCVYSLCVIFVVLWSPKYYVTYFILYQNASAKCECLWITGISLLYQEKIARDSVNLMSWSFRENNIFFNKRNNCMIKRQTLSQLKTFTSRRKIRTLN